MNKKRKPKKKKNTKSPAQVTPEEESRLNSILENLKDIDTDNLREHVRSPEFAHLLVERLPADDKEAIRLLFAIKDGFGEKKVQKAIKKAIFKLRQKGVPIPEQESLEDAPPIFEKPERDEASAYVGPIDGTGNRGVLMMVPRIPRGVDMGIGIVNSEEGIVYFDYSSYSKKRSREIKDIFFEQTGELIETSVPHAATVIERAYKKNESKAGDASREYLKLRPWILENLSLLDRPAIHESINPEDIAEEDLTVSKIKRLLGHELMVSWIIVPDKMEPILSEISKAEQSPIIVSDDQRGNRINEIKEKAISELYPDSKQQVLKEELEEMAYIFFRRDEEEYARLSLAAAATMDEKESSMRINPFLKVFFERSLDYYFDVTEQNIESEDQGDNSSSLIVTP